MQNLLKTPCPLNNFETVSQLTPSKLNGSSGNTILVDSFNTNNYSTEEQQYNSASMSRWEKVIHLKRLQYDLPSGSTGDGFVQTLVEEILLLANGQECTERFICFIAVILQKEKMVRQAKDIRKVIERKGLLCGSINVMMN